MIIDQSDPKGTLSLVGKFIALHNLNTKLCELFCTSRKKAPTKFQELLSQEKTVRNRLCHELWEIINSDLIAANPGKPSWTITHEELLINLNDSESLRWKLVDQFREVNIP